MSNIFQITQEYLELASILEDNGGELTPEIESTLQINKEQLQGKAVNYAFVIRKLDHESDIISNEIKRLQALKKSKDNTIDRMKNTIKDAMLTFGVDKIQGDFINISIRKTPDSVIIEDEDLIPDDYLVEQPKKIDKRAISEELKLGFEISGAYLKTDGKSITIR